MTERDWQARMAEAVGRNVRSIRESRSPKMSAQALAEETARIGHHIQRPVITNLENGRRAAVTVADVFTLAQALRVPPFALLAPLTTSERVEVLPGEFLSQWDAVDWFTGDLIPEDEAASPGSTQIVDAYQMRFAYRVAVMQFVDTFHTAERAQGVERAHALDSLASQRRYIEQLRQALQRLGVSDIPPPTADPAEVLGGH